MAKFPSVAGLSCWAVDEKPRDFDWSEGYGETWDVIVGLDKDGEGGPMMNYYYPIGELPPARAVRKALRHLPLCAVSLSGNETGNGLALTGGGMDLSWEICEAYMRLGYLPPVHFRLPAMAGRGDPPRDRWVVRGVVRANEIVATWAKSRIEATRALVKPRATVAR